MFKQWSKVHCTLRTVRCLPLDKVNLFAQHSVQASNVFMAGPDGIITKFREELGWLACFQCFFSLQAVSSPESSVEPFLFSGVENQKCIKLALKALDQVIKK